MTARRNWKKSLQLTNQKKGFQTFYSIPLIKANLSAILLKPSNKRQSLSLLPHQTVNQTLSMKIFLVCNHSIMGSEAKRSFLLYRPQIISSKIPHNGKKCQSRESKITNQREKFKYQIRRVKTWTEIKVQVSFLERLIKLRHCSSAKEHPYH